MRASEFESERASERWHFINDIVGAVWEELRAVSLCDMNGQEERLGG